MLVTNVSTDSIQSIQADVVCANQLLQQQHQSISSLNTNMYNLSNIIVNGFDLGNDSDTASTGTGTDSLNSIREFAQNFCKGKHK